MEIDELQYKQLTQHQKFLADALSNPKARALLLKAQKELNPNTPIPEIDAKDAVLEEVNGVRSALEEIKKQMAEAEAKRAEAETTAKLAAQWSEGRRKASKSGYDGEALETLEKFMEEKGIADHEIAIAAFERFHPERAKPVASDANHFDFFNRTKADEDKLHKQLWDGDIEGFTDSAVADTLKQMREGMAA
jgi:hypothetical protein